MKYFLLLLLVSSSIFSADGMFYNSKSPVILNIDAGVTFQQKKAGFSFGLDFSFLPIRKKRWRNYYINFGYIYDTKFLQHRLHFGIKRRFDKLFLSAGYQTVHLTDHGFFTRFDFELLPQLIPYGKFVWVGYSYFELGASFPLIGY